MAKPQRTRRQCTSGRRVTAGLLLSFLAFATPVATSTAAQVVLKDTAVDDVRRFQHVDAAITTTTTTFKASEHRDIQKFTLRHIFHHGLHKHTTLHRQKDVPPHATVQLQLENGEKEPIPELYISSQPLQIQRLKDRRPSTINGMLRAQRASGAKLDLPNSAWATMDIPGPNVTDKDTVLAMAYMTYDAYYFNESDPSWYDVGGGYNRSLDFGWESNGLRGHVFASEDNSTVVLGLKGTTVAYWDGNSDTTSNDKTNDNLFGSCCCGQQGPFGNSWKQVCDCATGTYTANSTCLKEELYKEDRYYPASLNLYNNVTAMYPDANIWLVGHSLGGLVGALLGVTYGVPAVSFEAVPDQLAMERLGIPRPKDNTVNLTGIYHFGHTADPVYMGEGNSASAGTSLFGYAFQSQCHSGKSCTYDTVKDKNYGSHIYYHQIVWVINNVLKVYDTVPICEETSECVDCYNWNFEESHNKTSTTSTSMTSTTTYTRTRTETCKTPGWWGCLDETATATSTAGQTSTGDVTTTSLSTSTCTTKGWFGCLDRTSKMSSTATKTSTSSDITATPTSTTTCITPGWFGRCLDMRSTRADKVTFPIETRTLAVETNGVHIPTITPAPIMA